MSDISVDALVDLVGVEDIALGRGTWSRTSSTGGTVTVEKLGIKAFLPGYANVKEWGAEGDGQTDDTAAIQAAIDSLAIGSSTTSHNGKRGYGGVVYFPPGIYKTTGPLYLLATSGAHNITLEGVGPLATVILNTGVGTDAIRVEGADGNSVHGFSIRNMTVQGASNTGRGLLMDHVIHLVTLERVDFYNHGGGGVRIEDVSNNITLRSVRAWNENSVGFTALDVVGIDLWSQAEQVWMYGIHVRGFETGVRVAKYQNVVGIYGGFIDQNALGLAVRASDDDFDAGIDTITVDGVYFEKNGRDIRLNNEDASPTNWVRNVTVRGCSFSQTSGYDGPYNTGTQQTYLGSPAPHSILLGKARGCHIENNTWRKIGVAADGSWPTSIRALIRGSTASEDNIISGSSVLDTVGLNNEAVPLQVVLVDDDGLNGGVVRTPEDYGAVGDGVTDDWAAIQSMFDRGGSIFIPGKTYASSKGPLIINSDHCKVRCDGTIKLLPGAVRQDLDGVGAATAVIHIRDCQGVSWNGGVIDGNNVIGVNGMAISHNTIFRSEFGEYNDRTLISDIIVRNCIHDTTLDTGGLTPHSGGIGNGGGKGLTYQFGSPQSQASNVRIHDCTIGVSYEGGSSPQEQEIPDLIVSDLSVTDCMIGVHFRGLYGPSGGDDLGSDEFSSVWTNCTFSNCGVGFAPTGVDLTATDFGVINAIKGTNISMVNLKIRNPSGIVTPFRGQFRNCYFQGEVDAKQILHVLDFRRDLNGADPTAGETSTRHNEFRLLVKARGDGTPGDQITSSIITDAGTAYVTKYNIFGLSYLIGDGANDYAGNWGDIVGPFFENADVSTLDATNIWDLYDRGSGKWSKGGGTSSATNMLT